MYKTKPLKSAASYSKRRVGKADVSLDNFITTDNLLPAKTGVGPAVNLPPQDGAMPGYEEGNILVSNIRPYLKKIWFANRSGGCSADVLVFDVKDSHHPEFIYYSMFRDVFFDHMMRGSKGTKMPRGDKMQVMDFKIPDIDIGNQKKIAAVLSALDAKIELNNRINAELEAMAKTLYDYWFVQFDFPDANGRPYKSSGGKMVYNEKLKRDIPEGWDVGVLDRYCSLTRGVTFAKKDSLDHWEKNYTPVLRATNINNSRIDFSDLVYVPSELVAEKQLIRKGDIVVTMSSGSKAHVGKCGLVFKDSECAFGAFCSKVSAHDDARHYVSMYFLSEYFKAHILNMCLGTNINNLNNDHISQAPLCCPPDELLEQFENIIQPIFEKIGCNEEQNQQLTSLRDFLLPMLMNGQVQAG